MRYFPINIDLSTKKILVVGAGAVGLRKTAAVLACAPAELLLMDLRQPPESALEQLRVLCSVSGQASPLKFEQGEPSEAHLEGRFIVFACTASRELNHQLAQRCEERGILCNVADAPLEGDFIVPAHFERDGLQLAISTAGQSPALARYLREELESVVEKRFSALLKIMGRLRPVLLELGLDSSKNAEIFRSLVHSALPESLNKSDLDEAALILHQYLPAKLHHHIGELLHDCR